MFKEENKMMYRTNQPMNVREANQWLKRQGATQFKFSSRADSFYGKAFVFSQFIDGKWEMQWKSPGLGELIEYAIVYGHVRRDWT